ncbi:MAG: RraA family protein [Terriglobia bacterium]
METTLSPEQFEALRRLDTCTVANAIEVFNVRQRNEWFVNDAVAHSIFPHFPPMLGYAVTGTIRSAAPPLVSSLPPPRILSYCDRTDWWNYVLSIPAPRVVVMQDLDHIPGTGALFGEVHSSVCRALGCAGYVTNGAVRDLPAVESLGFQLFAGHVSVSHAYAHIVEFGEPVEIGGVRIHPGDLIQGDRHGVQSIPKIIAAKIPAVVEELSRGERPILELCASPRFSLDGLREMVNETLHREAALRGDSVQKGFE